VNTDTEVMALYLTELIKQLDVQDRNWRENSVLFLDNASYHSSPATRQQLAFLRAPVIYSGPYSYMSAPCELFFAHFKKG